MPRKVATERIEALELKSRITKKDTEWDKRWHARAAEEEHPAKLERDQTAAVSRIQAERLTHRMLACEDQSSTLNDGALAKLHQYGEAAQEHEKDKVALVLAIQTQENLIASVYADQGTRSSREAQSRAEESKSSG